MGFGQQMLKALDMRGMTRADLCRLTGLKSGHLAPYVKDPDRDPRLSTAVKVARALGVSLEYLAGIEEPSARPSYADPGQAELNACWESCNRESRAALLVVARNSAGESKSEAGKTRGTEGKPDGAIRRAG